VTAAVASEIPGMEDVEDGADSSTEDGAPTPGDSGTAGRPSLRCLSESTAAWAPTPADSGKAAFSSATPAADSGTAALAGRASE
jgi:hypothetical protein